MNDLGKTLGWPATDALRGTVRCDQLRMLLFEFPELRVSRASYSASEISGLS